MRDGISFHPPHTFHFPLALETTHQTTTSQTNNKYLYLRPSNSAGSSFVSPQNYNNCCRNTDHSWVTSCCCRPPLLITLEKGTFSTQPRNRLFINNFNDSSGALSSQHEQQQQQATIPEPGDRKLMLVQGPSASEWRRWEMENKRGSFRVVGLFQPPQNRPGI